MAAIELNSSSLISDANLKAYWRLEADSNATISAINGSDTSITYSSGNGKFGNGAGFNGTSSFIEFNRQTTVEFTASMSVIAWFKTSSATDQIVVNNWVGNGLAQYWGWQLKLDNAGVVQIRTGTSTGENSVVVSDSGGYADGNYHMAVFVKDGSDIKLYVDNVLQASTISFATLVYSADVKLRIGRGNHSNSSQEFYNAGAVDDISLWDRALTASDINLLFNNPTSTAAAVKKHFYFM